MAPTLDAPLGSLLMIGFDGLEADDGLLRFLVDESIGGVILFRRNVESAAQVARLVRDLREARPGLLVAIDEEGGKVRRLSPDFTTFPSMHLVGRIGSEELAARLGEAIAAELAAIGVNWDFAPVLDVHTDERNPIIGERALSSRPELVARLGAAFVLGMQERGVAACGKHFPGHGATLEDSHLTLPVVERSVEEIDAEELVPFVSGIEVGIAALMTAHVLYRSIDPERPATLSPTILRDLLRDRLGFDGVVVTDDLEMRGAADLHGPGELGVASLEAGADLLLVCKEREVQRAVLAGVREAAAAGRLGASILAPAIRRMAQLSQRYAPLESPDPERARQRAGQARELVAEIERAAGRLA